MLEYAVDDGICACNVNGVVLIDGLFCLYVLVTFMLGPQVVDNVQLEIIGTANVPQWLP